MDFCESVHGVLAGFTYAYAATATPATAWSDATVASRNATVAHAGKTQMARRTEPAPLYWYASSSRWRRVAIATAPLDGSHCLRQWRSFSRTLSAASPGARAQGVCGVSGGFRERGNGGAMRIAALGVAVAAGLIVAILVPQQILTASRAAAPPLRALERHRRRTSAGIALTMRRAVASDNSGVSRLREAKLLFLLALPTGFEPVLQP